MRVRITQIDGKLPNLALMRLSSWHKAQGDEVIFSRRVTRDLLEGEFDRVYGSAIFAFSGRRIERFRAEYPEAILGGTGTDSALQVEDIIGDWRELDYAPWPAFSASIGFTQRGCRMKCRFCVVPQKEGRNRSASTISEIWRGDPWPKNLHLLDNDFFGQEEWQERIREIREGGFRVCLNQGINVRLIDDSAAEALASIEYRNDAFDQRLIYTAWDNLGDERRFMDGIDCLERAGIPPRHVMAYMLIGYDRRETWERIFRRFDAMVARGVLPYPMVYDQSRDDLKQFQRWVVRGLYRAIPWREYDSRIRHRNRPDSAQLQLLGASTP